MSGGLTAGCGLSLIPDDSRDRYTVSVSDKDAIIDLVSSVSGEVYLKVEESLGEGYVRLRVSEAERRQARHDIRGVEDVVVELLRNSRDAHAQMVFLASSREGDMRVFTVLDDGVGIPPALHDAVFEPRVTSKLETMVMDRWGVHGRGMALFSVRSNVSSAKVTASEPHRGASLAVTADTIALAERSDQSTWPEVEPGEDGRPRVTRGPHNIIRRVAEFACEHPELDVYIGTPTEIVATLHCLARETGASSRLLFCDDLCALPLWQRPAAASDAAELVDISASIGLEISERTAHRILGDGLEPLTTVVEHLSPRRPVAEPGVPDIYKDRRGLRIHATDLAELKRGLHRAFDPIAERYYVQLRGEPRVTVGRNRIRVTYEIEKDE